MLLIYKVLRAIAKNLKGTGRFLRKCIRMVNKLVVVLTAATITTLSPALADEGMWLVNQFPVDRVQKAYGVTIDAAFLHRIQLASARFNNGGSGSFVSPDGLLFTNHHVGRDCIQAVSTAENDYIAKGFYAPTRAEEKKCPSLEINILQSIETVTPKIRAAEKPSMSPAELAQARRAEMARIEKECSTRTGNRCDVVTLYSGGRYDLYQFRKYTDIRLVFAPEESIAAFGGDPDNFTYPRYCLDFSFFRAYENGKPVDSREFYFPWSRQGVQENELVMVPGNPGSTARLNTMAQLEFSRDVSYPLSQARLAGLVKALEEYGARSPENKRVAGDDLLSAQNSYKAYTGFLKGLRDPELMGRKKDEEQTLRAAVNNNGKWREEYGSVWDDLAKAYKEYSTYYSDYFLSKTSFPKLFDIARLILRRPVEVAKPNGERLREYRDSNLESLDQELYSPAPITPSLEIAELAEDFRFMRDKLGADDELVKKVLGGKSPEEAAREYVSSSKLADVAERKRLATSAEAVASSDDGMIRLARLFESRNRELRKRVEDELDPVLTRSAARIAQAKFAIEGENTYPDATFTFRVAYGRVTGYTENGRKIPYATVIRGLYARATGKEPFALPESWKKAKSKISMDTPFNFVSTADTHGGNSGSPSINAKGEIVGILFDGNLESLPNRFVYTDKVSRSVHVASQGIVEALRTVYAADPLLKELGVAR